MNRLRKPLRKEIDPKNRKQKKQSETPHVNKKHRFLTTLKIERKKITPQNHSLFHSTSYFGVTKIPTLTWLPKSWKCENNDRSQNYRSCYKHSRKLMFITFFLLKRNIYLTHKWQFLFLKNIKLFLCGGRKGVSDGEGGRVVRELDERVQITRLDEGGRECRRGALLKRVKKTKNHLLTHPEIFSKQLMNWIFRD